MLGVPQAPARLQPRRLLSSPGPRGVRLRARRRERTQWVKYSGGATYVAKRGKDPAGALLDLPFDALPRPLFQPLDKFTMTIIPPTASPPSPTHTHSAPRTRHGSRIFILNPRVTGKPFSLRPPSRPRFHSLLTHGCSPPSTRVHARRHTTCRAGELPHSHRGRYERSCRRRRYKPAI